MGFGGSVAGAETVGDRVATVAAEILVADLYTRRRLAALVLGAIEQILHTAHGFSVMALGNQFVRTTLFFDQGEEDVRPVVQSVEPIDSAVAGAGAGLKVYIESAEAYPGIKACLSKTGKGIVTLVVMADEGLKEVHMDLPGRYQVDPKLKGALKSLHGVAQVEEV